MHGSSRADEAREQSDQARSGKCHTRNCEPCAGVERELELRHVDASRKLESPNTVKEPQGDGQREHGAECAQNRRFHGNA
jgi:hypothetical protein